MFSPLIYDRTRIDNPHQFPPPPPSAGERGLVEVIHCKPDLTYLDPHRTIMKLSFVLWFTLRRLQTMSRVSLCHGTICGRAPEQAPRMLIGEQLVPFPTQHNDEDTIKH
jgi:hypothetical protein